MHLTLWYQAAAAAIGIIIETNDRDALKQRLYAARKSAVDKELEGISIVMDPIHSNRLWMIKRKVPDELATP